MSDEDDVLALLLRLLPGMGQPNKEHVGPTNARRCAKFLWTLGCSLHTLLLILASHTAAHVLLSERVLCVW